MDFTREQCLVLIDLYHERPILWNPNNPCYFNKVKKVDAWQELGELCGKDVEILQKKIDSLKGSYRREKAKVRKSMRTGKGKDKIYTSKWFAFDHLRFLEEKVEQGSLNSEFDEEGKNVEIEIQDISTGQFNQTETEHFEDTKSTRATIQNEVSTKTFNSSKKRTFNGRIVQEDPRIKEAFGYPKKAATTTEDNHKDDCSVFGEHVANKLRNLDDRLRAIAQHQISNVIFELEMTRYSEPNS